MVLELFDFAPVLPAPFLSVCFGVSYNSKHPSTVSNSFSFTAIWS